MIDGDDYWTSPDKLRRQVEFLEEHPGCTLVFHGVRVFRDEDPEVEVIDLPGPRERWGIEDILGCGNFIHGCTALMRRDIFDRCPEWLYKPILPDWEIYIWAAQHGWFGAINEALGAYRLHSQGMWTGLTREAQIAELIRFFRRLEKILEPSYRPRVRWARSFWYDRLSSLHASRGRRAQGWWALVRSIALAPSNPHLTQSARRRLQAALRRGPRDPSCVDTSRAVEELPPENGWYDPEPCGRRTGRAALLTLQAPRGGPLRLVVSGTNEESRPLRLCAAVNQAPVLAVEVPPGRFELSAAIDERWRGQALRVRLSRAGLDGAQAETSPRLYISRVCASA
jgi:hypothetical protein